ncbi:MAG: DUF6502 family protein [Steroidobacteraceae bacterium]
MQSDFRAALVHLCSRVLYPLVRILIHSGISAGEFKSIVDSAYARVGLDYLASAGGPVTHSRLAVITGINRTALAAILAIPPGDDFKPRSGTQLHRAARVLHGWHDDPDFVTQSGKPIVLTVKGDERSFEALAQRYSGGLYYQTILVELVRLGAAQRVGSTRVRALRRSLDAGGQNAESVFAAGEVAGDLMSTLEHNLASGAVEQLPVRSLVLETDARSLPLFRAQIGRRADAFVEQVEGFLEAHRPERVRKARGEPKPESLTLGAAVFAVLRKSEPSAAAAPPEAPKTASD